MPGVFTLASPWSGEATLAGESAFGPFRESYNWGAALAAKKITVTLPSELTKAEALRDLKIFTEA